MSGNITVTFIGGPADLSRRVIPRCRTYNVADLPDELACYARPMRPDDEIPLRVTVTVVTYIVMQVGRDTWIAVPERDYR